MVKLGGSLATVKDRGFTPNINWLRRVARVLASLPHSLLIVVGGGSYGHYAVAASREAGAEPQDTVATVAAAMLELALLVADVLQDAGLRPLVYPPHAFCKPEGLKPNCNWSYAAKALETGLTPVTYGDIYPAKGGYGIVSGDELAAEAACSLGAGRVVYLSNVPGVLDGSGKTIPVLGRKELELILSRGTVGGSASGVDVTGGMRRKLEAILANSCPGLEALIVDGREPEELPKLLAAGAGGTRLVL